MNANTTMKIESSDVSLNDQTRDDKFANISCESSAGHSCSSSCPDSEEKHEIAPIESSFVTDVINKERNIELHFAKNVDDESHRMDESDMIKRALDLDFNRTSLSEQSDTLEFNTLSSGENSRISRIDQSEASSEAKNQNLNIGITKQRSDSRCDVFDKFDGTEISRDSYNSDGNRGSRPHSNVYERLYQNAHQMEKSKHLARQEVARRESMEMTFQPNVSRLASSPLGAVNNEKPHEQFRNAVYERLFRDANQRQVRMHSCQTNPAMDISNQRVSPKAKVNPSSLKKHTTTKTSMRMDNRRNSANSSTSRKWVRTESTNEIDDGKNNSQVFDRLYTQHCGNDKMNDLLKAQRELGVCTFKPKINSVRKRSSQLPRPAGASTTIGSLKVSVWDRLNAEATSEQLKKKDAQLPK